MLSKRIIACLDVRDGRVVKGINFEGLREAGDPALLARRYNVEGIDESGAEARIRIRPASITPQSSLPPAEDFCDVSSQPKQNENIETVFLSSNTIGRGSDELGALLMRAFLYTLTESDIVPKRLLLMNSGVLLAVEGSEHLTNLRRLVDLDVEILVCGTCLEFFKVKDTLAVGRISNMQEIQGALMEGRALSL